MINNIYVNDFKVWLGGDENQHSKYKGAITEIIRRTLTELETKKIRFYNFRGEYNEHKVGNKNDILFFVNATEKKDFSKIELDEVLKINDIEVSKVFLEPKGEEDCVQIKYEDVVLAEWVDSSYQLDILFNLFDKEYNVDTMKIFEYIMTQFNELVWKEKLKESSWKYSSKKADLTKAFTRRLGEIKSRDIARLKNEVEAQEDNIESWKKKIKVACDTLARHRRTIEIETANLNNVSSALLNDFDLIIAHEKIHDLIVEGSVLNVFTNPLYIYSDRGTKHYGGKYKIVIDMDNTNVRFFGDNPRKSYWTDNDPHPHVNGSNGRACLGNTESTIAELCSQMQAYALVMICIDFLEAANTSDPAGKYVKNWEEVEDEEYQGHLDDPDDDDEDYDEDEDEDDDYDDED